MSVEIEFGLKIMAIGMITVFSILGLVVIGGKVMILAINRFAPEDPTPPSSPTGNSPISNTKVSLLSSVVAVITSGKGKITKIKKL